jgi:outer membrane protein assembly factor BamB
MVIVSTRLALYGLDLANGQQRWKHNSGPHPSPPPIIVAGKNVIYGEGKYIFALDAGTGDIVWQHRIKSHDMRSLVANQNFVYAVAQPTQIDALDVGAGELIWSLDGYENDIETRGPKLFLQDDDLYLFTAEVHILDANTGEIKQVFEHNLIPGQLAGDRIYGNSWIRRTRTLDLITKLHSPNSQESIDSCENFKAPYVFWENWFFAVGECGGIYALESDSNRIEWEYREDIVGENPTALYQNRLYVLFENGEIHAINPKKGQEEGILKTDQVLPGSVRDANFS